MEHLFKTFQLACGLAIAIGLFMVYFGLKDQTKEYWQQPGFRTDSIKVDIDYSKLKIPEFKIQIPPVKVVEYQTPEAPKAYISLNDSLITVIDSLKNHIYTINTLYLKLYPEASKLIYGEFTHDSLRLDLLTPEGRIISTQVASNFSKYVYQYKNNAFRAQGIRQNAQAKGFKGALYSYTGYEAILSKPLLGIDYTFHKGPIRLSGDVFMYIESKPKLTLRGTIGYRLNGN